MENIKLNLGSGDMAIAGYVNIDIKNGEPAYPLKYDDNTTVDEIRASHILEHFSRKEVPNVLMNWVSKLKIGGVLKIAVPDFAKISALYAKGEEIDWAGFICGGQTDQDDFHRSVFDEPMLKKIFERLGLTDIKKWESEMSDCAKLPISLNLQGTKTGDNLEFGEVGFADVKNKPFLEELSKKRRNIYSQNGEDGIIEAIFEKIGTKNKWCLEVGASDGILFSNTRRLVEQEWDAILIEKDSELFEQLGKNCREYLNVRYSNVTIDSESTLDVVLQNAGAPKDIDLVCIDIDGQDWHVWNQMIEYRPRVVVIEYQPESEDSNFIPTIGGPEQAGKQAIYNLAASKLYHNMVVTKYNIIAIRNDVWVTEVLKEEWPFDVCSDNKKPEPDVKIAAVMSMPRLAFTDNIFAAVRSLIPLGINLEKGCGVFWGQVLTRLMEMHIDDGTEYIIAVDYDTYFTKNQVIKLLQLMQENPEADAIIPLQTKRECDYPLIGRCDGKQRCMTEIPTAEFQKDLMPITTGHFGLTIFRVEALRKLKKPWFLPIPDSNGGWDEGRRDEDIYFWHNFAKSGLNAFLAPHIGLPHLQLMATVPGKLQDGFKPQHFYITDLEKNGLPEWCEPKVELLK